MTIMSTKFTFSPEIDAILAMKVEDCIRIKGQILSQVASMEVVDSSKENPFPFDAFTEFYWHCSTFFSLLDQTKILQLLTALLLEETVIFVDDDAGKISSAVFALKLLLRPFYWPYVLVSVLPNELLETLDAPLSLLVGISQQ